MDGALTVGELAKRAGVATSAVRFYEEKGLLRSDRTDAGHRRFSRSALRRVAFITFAQKVGLSLEEIGLELARLPAGRIPQREDWTSLTGVWVTRIDERIAELRRLRSSLTECIGCGCLSLETCALANPRDKAGRGGAGPQYWIRDAKDGGRE